VVPKKGKHLFTSESVTEGHPDKMCDQISDSVLDALLEQDPSSRVACECLTTTGLVLVTGEITTTANVDYPNIVRNTLIDIGYTGGNCGGFDAETCNIMIAINKQSPDISNAVTKKFEKEEEMQSVGAGDQGLVFGFACDETPEFMPYPISLAHKLARKLSEVRKNGTLPYLRPDGKTQVTAEYIDGKVSRVDTIIVSAHHASVVNGETSNEMVQEIINRDIMEHVIKPVVPEELLIDTKYYINPSGRFTVGGPQGDAGLTGRKIIIDTYGGFARHGGGAFSGKDSTKVDRSAAYAARHAAKNIVAAGLAEKCEIQISYAIGIAEPVSIAVETFETSKISDEKLLEIIKTVFDFRPAYIISRLGLRKPLYRQVASYGHFGRDDLDLPWEKLDKVDVIKELAEECLCATV